MRLLALSGSLREQSTNSALLETAARLAPDDIEIIQCKLIGELPIFSPDLEGPPAPDVVERLAQQLRDADGLLISCPEYVYTLPGGFKNAIDWLVSREELINKPIALLHASHRGDDALMTLRKVLATVSSRFSVEIFERFSLVDMSPTAIANYFDDDEPADRLRAFLRRFSLFCRET